VVSGITGMSKGCVCQRKNDAAVASAMAVDHILANDH